MESPFPGAYQDMFSIAMANISEASLVSVETLNINQLNALTGDNIDSSASITAPAFHGPADSAIVFTGVLAGDVTGGMTSTSIAPGVVVDAMVSPLAGIQDTKLATIATAGKVANSANTRLSGATALAVPSTLVLRDISGGFAAGTITATLNGSSVTFTGNLTGVVTSVGMATAIANAAITNAMLAQLTAANLVANSANPLLAGATAAATNGTLVLRDNTNFTNVAQLTTSNIYLNTNNPSGNRYNYIQMLGGNSSGFMYGAFTALGDGINLGYNFYYNANSATPTIPNTGGGTSRLQLGYGVIRFCTGATNTTPTNWWSIGSTGNLSGSPLATFTTPSIAAASGGTVSMLANLDATGYTITASTLTTGTLSFTNLSGGSITGSALTITSGAATQGAIKLLSGGTSNYVTQGIGRTASEVQLGVCGANGNFFTDTMAGDAIIIGDNINSASNWIRLGCRSAAGNYGASAMTIRYGNRASTVYTDGAVTINGALGVSANIIGGSGITGQSVTSLSSLTTATISCSSGASVGSLTTASANITAVTAGSVSCSGNGTFGSANVSGALQSLVAVVSNTCSANRFAATTLVITPAINAPAGGGAIDFGGAPTTNITIDDATNNVTADRVRALNYRTTVSLSLTTSYQVAATISPPAGNYIVSYTLTGHNSTASNATLNHAIFVGAGNVTTNIGTLLPGAYLSYCDSSAVSVTSGQAVTVRANCNVASTGQVISATMTLVPTP